MRAIMEVIGIDDALSFVVDQDIIQAETGFWEIEMQI